MNEKKQEPLDFLAYYSLLCLAFGYWQRTFFTERESVVVWATACSPVTARCEAFIYRA